MIVIKRILIATVALGFVSIPLTCFSKWSSITKKTEVQEYAFLQEALIVEHGIGNVIIKPWTTNDTIEITATKKAQAHIIDNITISYKVIGNKASIKTHIPPNVSNISVDLTLKVPATLKILDVNVAIGTVSIKNIKALITASTTTGSIAITNAASDVSAHVTTGAINVSYQSLIKTHTTHLNTTTGSITLTLPQHSNAHINAQATLGPIFSEFSELKVTKPFPYTLSTLKGILGNAHTNIELKTVTGSISIKKAI